MNQNIFFLVGYPFGGVTYQFCGKMTPFLIIGALCILEGGKNILHLNKHIRNKALNVENCNEKWSRVTSEMHRPSEKSEMKKLS